MDRTWFENPQLSAPTPLTVDADGRVFGHIATWGTCHTGNRGCLTPPRSKSGYAYFRTGEVRFDDGSAVPVGQITVGGGHAGLSLNANAAAAHYDSTSTAACDVAAGEDEFGIWVAGATRPGISEEMLHALRAAAPSGDWRQINGVLELVAVLQVNVPGFPVPRARVLVAAGAPEDCNDCAFALVAAGILSHEPETAAEQLASDTPAQESPLSIAMPADLQFALERYELKAQLADAQQRAELAEQRVGRIELAMVAIADRLYAKSTDVV